ncbi:MAG TPA: ABC transporter ATP-binding protein [Candidatus Acidoferrum sp.]
MAVAAIEIQNLTKDYPYGFLQLKKKRSLEALTMQVQRGEVFGFLGPNGAGKSTTIKLLMRLIFPTAGSARILGKPVSDISMHKDIGYLPEQPYFYDYLTAAELLHYFARFHDFSATERGERVARMLQKVGLESAGRIQLRKYSKGMLQRVGLAQAILHDPSVVVLDEPMSGLDPVGRREVRDIILELKQQGKTVLFSTHILSDAEMLCDRVGVIVGGKLQGIGAPSEIVGLKAHGMEILFELAASPAAASQSSSNQSGHEPSQEQRSERSDGSGAQNSSALLAKATRTGDRYRLHIEESDLYPALEQLRAAGAKILSVTQVKPSLEEYFMHLVAADRAQASAVEVHAK